MLKGPLKLCKELYEGKFLIEGLNTVNNTEIITKYQDSHNNVYFSFRRQKKFSQEAITTALMVIKGGRGLLTVINLLQLRKCFLFLTIRTHSESWDWTQGDRETQIINCKYK